MRVAIRVLALSAIGAAAFAPAVHAQDMTTTTFNGTTIWVGGGFQYLTLPDIKFTAKGNIPDVIDGGRVDFHQKNSDFSEYGGGGGGGIETALGYWGGWRVTGGVKGFFTSLENSDRKGCDSSGDIGCIAFDPTGQTFGAVRSFVTKTDRDVDYWGGQVEFKFGGGQPVYEKPNLYRNDYFIIGADIRGIDQDIKIVNHAEDFSSDIPFFTYRETLDTTYTGGYVGFGGEYSFGFIPFLGSAVKGRGGLYDRLGLRTFINARGGLYSAETDYDGNFNAIGGAFVSKLSRSNDELAFIGSISLETRKQFGPRTSLSLWTDYEYISSVPEIRYSGEIGQPTRIDEDDAFATRTMLRLNIGLGAQQLYQEPLK